MTAEARLGFASFDPAVELAALIRDSRGAGAVVTFVGLARDMTKSSEPLDALVVEHHPRLSGSSLDAIAADALQHFAVSHVRVVHRAGAIAPGEPIVFVGAASAHRRAAFEAADYLMDRLKTDAVLWKREDTLAGRTWIEPTDADYGDRGRWE